MKSFFVLCVVLVAGICAAYETLPPTQTDIAKQIGAECIKESGVSTEVLAEAKRGHITEDEGLKKFNLCFFKKAGIVGSDGKLTVEVALSRLPPGVDKDEAKKALEGCKSKTGMTPEDAAFEIFKCYHQETMPYFASQSLNSYKKY